MTRNQQLVAEISPGERRVTIMRKRVVVAIGPDDTGGKLRFYFEDEGPQNFHQQIHPRRWLKYKAAPAPEAPHEHRWRIAAGGFLANHISLRRPDGVAVLEDCPCGVTRVVVERRGRRKQFHEGKTLDDLGEILT